MAAPVAPGDVLAGKYVVERLLGEGGMGVVVSATHQQLGQRVAVKFLLEEILANQEAVARFLREAQAAVQIQSEHVARVIDVGTLENGAPYLVMEYLGGRDLADELAARGQLGVEEAVRYVLQACEAVAEAHAIGIVHRDLKPANLFLAKRADGTPMVKVLDFGISKAMPGAGKAQNLTSTQSVMGSPLYMSPEQLKSTKNVDQRTDIWALGVILHELLAGAPPFKSDTVSGLIATVVTEQPPPLRALRSDVPEELERVVLKCLEKDPVHRVSHIGDLAVLLQPFAPKQAEISVPRITGVLGNAGFQTFHDLGTTGAQAAVGGQTGFGQVAPARDVPRGPRYAAAFALVGVALVLVVGIAAVALLGRRPAEPAAAPTAEPVAPASAVVPATKATPSTAEPEPSTSAPTAQSAAPVEPRATPPQQPAAPRTTPAPTAVATTKPRPRATVNPLDGRR